MKRILALDGGGIRGVFTLQILAQIEGIFRAEHDDKHLRLADVFDLIAGTSTGAIIATFLSWGLPVREIEKLYIEQSPAMFSKGRWTDQWRAKYKPQAIARFFNERFIEEDGSPALLGTKKLKTLLLVVMRNGSTGGSWLVTNNPKAIFNDPALQGCNLKFPLWQLLRASTAAPAFFPPEEIEVAGQKHLFMDGGMTPYNNPALAAFLTATLPAYNIGWPTGRESIHLTSVGTGLARAKMPGKAAGEVNMLDHIRYIAPALIGSGAWEQDFICRVIGDCVNGGILDSELGALTSPSIFPPEQQKFTYTRYDTPLDATHPKIKALPHGQMGLDNLKLIPLLQELGSEYASKHVLRRHLHPRSKDSIQ